uniref:Integrase catalytic domain-containing protein n=1 Tax=Fagus sylvatica TaxID=28930 RepID=A0A2N9FEG0_FAGSY
MVRDSLFNEETRRKDMGKDDAQALVTENRGRSKGEILRARVGIRHEKTVPGTPQHNGVAERINRTIVEKVKMGAEAFKKQEALRNKWVFKLKKDVVKMSSIRVILGLTASLDLELEQMDVKTAFLHGDLEEKIYMVQLEGFEILRDRKAKKLWLSQEKYVERVLERFNMKHAKPVSTPLGGHFKLSKKSCPSSNKEKENMASIPYSSAVGSLMYAMVCTWPDIAHAVGVVHGLSTEVRSRASEYSVIISPKFREPIENVQRGLAGGDGLIRNNYGCYEIGVATSVLVELWALRDDLFLCLQFTIPETSQQNSPNKGKALEANICADALARRGAKLHPLFTFVCVQTWMLCA